MPAERSKCSRRHGADGNELVWTLPVEPPAVDTEVFVFTPTITPVTFDEGPPPLVDPPSCEYILFPPADDCAAPRRAGHSKKKPEDHIPRPPNAFILFRSSFIKGNHVSSEVETNHSTLSKIIGLAWKGLPDGERQFWRSKAKAALDEHKRKFPQYAFRPNQGRGKGNEKRKVREVGPKDHKRCAKIAELLVEGKKGQDLDMAIQEFDKHHVPEVVTRFEAPITARSFRRSSSAPIPDADESKRHLSRQSRSSSTRPCSPVSSPAPMPPTSYPTTVAKQEGYPEAFDMPAFDQYSFSSQSAPFDLNAFSFDNHSSPMPSFACDPLTSPVSPIDCGSMSFDISDHLNDEVSSPLSPSFMGMDDWNRCSSPFSAESSSIPATPSASFPSSPCLDGYGSYPLEEFERSLAKSFGEYSAYTNTPESTFIEPQFLNPSTHDLSTGYDFSSSFAQDPTKVDMATQDLDFSAFMASLPEYSL